MTANKEILDPAYRSILGLGPVYRASSGEALFSTRSFETKVSKCVGKY